MILITGSGRSGTSITVKLLQQMGCQFAEMTDWIDDVRAGMECKEIVNLNKELFNINGKDDYYGFNWLDSGEVNKAAVYLSERIDDINTRYKGMYVKDPLFSKTLEPWLIAGLHIEHIIICQRNIEHIVLSAQKTGRGICSKVDMNADAVASEINKRRENLDRFINFKFLNYKIDGFSILRYENYVDDFTHLLSTLKLDKEKGAEVLKQFVQK